jgi:hypothetical protein
MQKLAAALCGPQAARCAEAKGIAEFSESSMTVSPSLHAWHHKSVDHPLN